uniref:Uncharacterized protein n=1 Tax=Elaeophora elaphi TaxID=1147741 RepID=A0A0R3RKW4_9BILA
MSHSTSPLLALFFSLLIVLLAFLQQNAADQLKFLESFNNNNSMNNWLHDFVRRGKGSVSKLPFEEIFIDQSDGNPSQIATAATVAAANTLTESNANIVKIGSDVGCLLILDEN